jgi:hypothetical protein
VTSKLYCWFLLLGVLLGALGVVGSSLALDHYGLFREPRGTLHKVYGSERTGKYLLARRYVPANFNALMIGGSVTSNWNTKLVAEPRLYNASISGGNLSEEKLIAEQVMAARKLDWLVLCIHPYLTMTRGRKTEYMTPREYWSALGSIDLFYVEAAKLLADGGFRADHHNEYGDANYRRDWTRARQIADDYIRQRRSNGRPHRMFGVAPGALDDLRALVSQARAGGTRLAVVYPPVYKPRFDVERADWEAYWHKVDAFFPPGTRYLNFNDPEFDAGRADFANFEDGTHLSRNYADVLVPRIAELLKD